MTNMWGDVLPTVMKMGDDTTVNESRKNDHEKMHTDAMPHEYNIDNSARETCGS